MKIGTTRETTRCRSLEYPPQALYPTSWTRYRGIVVETPFPAARGTNRRAPPMENKILSLRFTRHRPTLSKPTTRFLFPIKNPYAAAHLQDKSSDTPIKQSRFRGEKGKEGGEDEITGPRGRCHQLPEGGVERRRTRRAGVGGTRLKKSSSHAFVRSQPTHACVSRFPHTRVASLKSSPFPHTLPTRAHAYT